MDTYTKTAIESELRQDKLNARIGDIISKDDYVAITSKMSPKRKKFFDYCLVNIDMDFGICLKVTGCFLRAIKSGDYVPDKKDYKFWWDKWRKDIDTE